MTFSLPAWCILFVLYPAKSVGAAIRVGMKRDGPPPAILHDDLGLPPASGIPADATALREALLR